jgi:hypothetical protein
MQKWFKNKLNWLTENPSERTLKRSLIAGFLLLVVSTPAIIWLLESSNYPGGLDETQLGFDGEYIRACFSTMSEEELTTFILGNLADYVFMVSYGVVLSCASLLLSRKLNDSRLRKIGLTISLLGVFAALSDAAENVFIISMAVNPQYFPGWLAIPHSLFAHLKFNCMYITSGWILLSTLIHGVMRI